jgi:anaerobic selenocysteine-containing dehydrogenase
MTTKRTMCPMNCHPTLCGMLVDVKASNTLEVRGDPENPDSRGFLCVRGRAAREVYDNPRRLLYPLVRDRRGDPLRRATWDEALERISEAIATTPPQTTAIWPGHGTFTTNYGTRVSAQLFARFANLHGSQFFNPTMICWGLGAFGLALTGMVETHTKEDLGEHSRLILLWGANFASQPNTARFVKTARARGARVVAIDVRQTEASDKADDVLLLRPGTDAALALALMHVICAEKMFDVAFVDKYTVGFATLAEHLQAFSPSWAAGVTGIAAERIVSLARLYSKTKPGVIVLGGSSMHKGNNGWQAARAVSCLPALTGNIGIPGAGFGPRHGASTNGLSLASVVESARRKPGKALPNQMASVIDGMHDGRIANLLLMGSNMLSSFADSGKVAQGLARLRLVVSYDLFLNETSHHFADVVLPSTAWLEELGCKATSTHLYLMEPVLAPVGDARPATWVMRELATRLELQDFFPWESDEALFNAILDHPSTGHTTVESLRAQGGIGELRISHVANPKLEFDTPSGKVEFFSKDAARLGLPALPEWHAPPDQPAKSRYPLTLTQGRSLMHFHSFYNNGRELPTLARREPEPRVWISPADAASRSLVEGGTVRVFNNRGELAALAHVTERIPAGTIWLRDGWPGLNVLTESRPVLPDAATDYFPFSAGQSTFNAYVEVRAM